jgi:hypothetical protein
VIEPRFAWFPPRERSLGAECCEFWRAAGGVLFDWQVFWIDGVLGLGDDDRFVSSDDGLCVARQNGKGVALQALELFFAFALGRKRGYKVIMHTAHEFATAQEHFFRLEDLIRNSPELHAMVKDKGGYMHANGRDSINLKDGTRIIFKARTSGGGRGYSADFLAWDEAMQIPAAVIGAQKPMLRASSAEFGPKTIYAGSAVDQEIHQNGVTFAFLRERGIENSPRVSFAEWSAPFDHPDQMTDGLLRDRRFWPCGNPSMADGLISEEWMADEIETTPGRVAAVEYDNVGDWPRTDGRIDTVISVEAWDSLVDLESALLPPYCLAIDVSPERQTSIALAGPPRDILTRSAAPGLPGVSVPEVAMRTVEPLEGTNISLFNTIIPNWWAENGLSSTASWSPGGAELAEQVWVANRCQQLNSQQIASMPLQFHGPDGAEPAWMSSPDPHWYPNGIGDALHAIVDQVYGWGFSCQYVTDFYATGSRARGRCCRRLR